MTFHSNTIASSKRVNSDIEVTKILCLMLATGGITERNLYCNMQTAAHAATFSDETRRSFLKVGQIFKLNWGLKMHRSGDGLGVSLRGSRRSV